METKKKKKIKAQELIDVRVEFVSYVGQPATGRKFKILKDKDGGIIEDECYTDNVEESEKVYNCECIDCGYKVKTDEHCKDIKCSKCGGTMRRVERPGPGQKKTEEKNISTENNTGKKSFKNFLLNLIKFDKRDKKEYNKKDDYEKFEEEVSEMSKVAEQIITTLKSIDSRLNVLEKGDQDSKSIIIKMETLKKEVEGKEGKEKEKLNKEIGLLEKMSEVKKAIETYKGQIQAIKEKMDSDGLDDEETEIFKSHLSDKEVLLSMLTEKEKGIAKELDSIKKGPEDDDKKDDTDTGDNKDKDDVDKAVLKEMTDISNRLEAIEKKRQPSNKVSVEIDKDILNKETDPGKSEFWSGVF